MTGESELLTVREVARRCGRSEETVRRWIWSEKLPARKLGNQLFVDEADLLRLQQGRVAEAGPRYRASTGRASARERRPKIDFGRATYDPEQKIRELEEDVKFGKMLSEKYGPVDITELMRQIREEDDE